MFVFFFFNDTATTEIYTLSLHDALPILFPEGVDQLTREVFAIRRVADAERSGRAVPHAKTVRSEEHTSELQSPCNLVCRLLLEKKTEISAHDKSRTSGSVIRRRTSSCTN